MEEEMADEFTYDWYHIIDGDFDQEIDGAMEEINDIPIPSSQKVAELLGGDENTEWPTIYLRHRRAVGVGFSKTKKFALWNATNEKLKFNVKYSFVDQIEAK